MAPLRSAEQSEVRLTENFWDSETFFKLFTALIFTCVFTFTLGHALAWNSDGFYQTLPAALIVLAVCLVLFGYTICFKSLSWGLLATYGQILTVTYLWRPLFVPLFFAAAVAGLVVCSQRLRLSRAHVLWTGFMGLSGALFIVSCAEAPFNVLQGVHAGRFYMDLPHHASLAAMIKNYGVASTGLHGLVPTPYHILSHAVMAGLSVLSGVPVIAVYGVAHWALLVPLLFVCLVYLATSLTHFRVSNLPLAWGMALSALWFLAWWRIPYGLRGAEGNYLVPNPDVNLLSTGLHLLYSESFVFSLGIFLLGSPLLFKRELGRDDLIQSVVVAGALALSKAPVGLIYAGLWGLRVLQNGNLRSRDSWFPFAAVLSIVLTILLAPAYTETTSGQVALGSSIGHKDDFGSALQGYPLIAIGLSIAVFVIQHFLYSLLFLAGMVRSRGIRHLMNSSEGLYVGGTFLLGLCVLLTLRFLDGNAQWFSHVAAFAALPLVIARSATLVEPKIDEYQLRMNQVPIEPIITLSCLLLFPVYAWPLAQLRASPITQNNPTIELLMRIRDQAPINSAFRDPSPDWGTLAPTVCWGRPLLYSAISERPWVDLLSLDDGCHYQNRGYASYPFDTTSRRVKQQAPLAPGMKVLSPATYQPRTTPTNQ